MAVGLPEAEAEDEAETGAASFHTTSMGFGWVGVKAGTLVRFNTV